MRPSTTCALFILTSLASGCWSPQEEAPEPRQINLESRVSDGAPESAVAYLLKQLAQAEGANLERLDLTLSDGHEADLEVEDYHLESGVLSMTGRSARSRSSSFILKGTEKALTGWLVLPDEDKAFKFSTSENGDLVAQTVNVEEVIPVCNTRPPQNRPPKIAFAPMGQDISAIPHVGTYDGSDLYALESLPGSDHVIWLDIRDIMNGDTPKYMVQEDIFKLWQSVSAGFSMFDVNVTTSQEVWNSVPVSNSGIAKFYDSDGRSYCGIGAFGTTNSCTLFYEEDGYDYGRIALHELGHLVGLSHDGGGGDGEYFEGFSAYRWTPVMGNIWPGDQWGGDALYQWSRGEYNGANEFEDDFEVIGWELPWKSDDIPGAEALLFSGSAVNVSNNFGQINDNGDSDSFTFTMGPSGGLLDVTIDRIEYIGGSMLDVYAELRDSSGEVVTWDSPEVSRSARITKSLSAGTYELVIEGGSEGTPSYGFSGYSSVGYYGIEGSITGAVGGGTGGTSGTGGTGGGDGNDEVVAHLYQHCDFDGWSVELTAGDFSTSDLLTLGALNNDASSLVMAPGYQAILFDGDDLTGTSVVAQGDVPCFVDLEFNDLLSSLSIESLDSGAGGDSSGTGGGGGFPTGGTGTGLPTDPNAGGGGFIASGGNTSSPASAGGNMPGMDPNAGIAKAPRSQEDAGCSLSPSAPPVTNGWLLALTAAVATSFLRRRRLTGRSIGA